MWPMRGRATGQGMFLASLSLTGSEFVLNRVWSVQLSMIRLAQYLAILDRGRLLVFKTL